MKKSVQDPSEYQVPWVSTNDALCAHMWRVVSRARGLGREESTIVIQANNLRKNDSNKSFCRQYGVHSVYRSHNCWRTPL
ncbi:transferase [Acrasis kona]|uniref:Transferase n=1 Tax=Acrasis kona TaxID=1008807 RepID=A0AAW2YID2_9EUKA